MQTATPRGEPVLQFQPGSQPLKLGLAGVVSALALYFSGWAEDFPVGIAVLFVLGVLGVGKGVWQWGRVMTCFTGGIEWGGRFIALEDLESMQLRIEAIAVAWFRDNTHYHLVLKGSDAEGPMEIRCDWQGLVPHCPRGEYLIDVVAPSIARRMEEELQRCGAVRWGRRLLLGPEGVTCEASGRQIAYGEIAEGRIRQALFTNTLVLRGRDGGEVRISTTENNFFPGYELLKSRPLSVVASLPS